MSNDKWVSVEWPDGTGVVGIVEDDLVRYAQGTRSIRLDNPNHNIMVTPIERPRPREPHRLGSVVRARFKSNLHEESHLRTWTWHYASESWADTTGTLFADWKNLTDIDIIREGIE